VAVSALGSHLGFAALAAWLDRQRVPVGGR